jgi:hypothetical protein
MCISQPFTTVGTILRVCHAARLLRTLAWAGVSRLVQVRQIPMDRRHNAKIDDGKLAKIVRRIR